MKKVLSLLILVSVFTCAARAQGFNKSVNMDSLFNELLKKVPKEMQAQLGKEYKSADKTTKEFMLFMISMPRSSKEELIKNIDSNFQNILNLQTEYAKFVPSGFTVSIEFNSPNILANSKESVDLRIEQKKDNGNLFEQQWNLKYGSAELDKMLKIIGWNETTLINIKKLLTDAHCISIENSNITTIGFARSGMGKYSFKLFGENLTQDEIKNYNDKCRYIFYKSNIVLEYGGGCGWNTMFSGTKQIVNTFIINNFSQKTISLTHSKIRIINRTFAA